MSFADYNPISHRELKFSPEPADYELLDPSDALIYAYVAGAAEQGWVATDEHHIDYEIQGGQDWTSFTAPARQSGKGKYILLVIDAPYEVQAPATQFDLVCAPHHGYHRLPFQVKGSYKRLAETMRSYYLASFPEQQQLPFLSVSESYVVEFSDQQRNRFHELVDRKLMGSISSGELSELENLEGALRSLEEHDPEEQSLRQEWSARLDGAIGELREINKKLEILIASGK